MSPVCDGETLRKTVYFVLQNTVIYLGFAFGVFFIFFVCWSDIFDDLQWGSEDQYANYFSRSPRRE